MSPTSAFLLLGVLLGGGHLCFCVTPETCPSSSATDELCSLVTDLAAMDVEVLLPADEQYADATTTYNGGIYTENTPAVVVMANSVGTEIKYLISVVNYNV